MPRGRSENSKPEKNLLNLLTCRVLLIGFVILAFVSCANNKRSPEGNVTYTDDLGRTVLIPDTPERVVTLAPNLTEIIFTAGADSLLVGVSNVDDYPPEVQSLPRYSILPVDFETIATLQPDLILATTHINSPRDAQTLEALGFPTVFLSFESISDVFEGIRTVGQLLGTGRVADSVVDSLTNQMNRLSEITSDISNPPDVLFLISDEPLFSFGRESYVHELINLAGGNSVTGKIDAVAPILNDEFVLANNPDVIIGTFGDEYSAAQLLDEHPTWSSVAAVQNERVYTIDENLVLRPGPRLIEAAWLMARMLHTEVFE